MGQVKNDMFTLKTTGWFPDFWKPACLPTDHCEDGVDIEGAMFCDEAALSVLKRR